MINDLLRFAIAAIALAGIAACALSIWRDLTRPIALPFEEDRP